MPVALNISASNNLLYEIVSCFGFQSACKYRISSSSNVPNLSNTVPNLLGISNKVCCQARPTDQTQMTYWKFY